MKLPRHDDSRFEERLRSRVFRRWEARAWITRLKYLRDIRADVFDQQRRQGKERVFARSDELSSSR